MTDHDTLAQRVGAVQQSPEYLAADDERAKFWAEFQQAERDGDGVAANAAWLKALDAKRRCEDMVNAARGARA